MGSEAFQESPHKTPSPFTIFGLASRVIGAGGEKQG